MERDFFKRYVEENKDAFENEALPLNMLGNILTNLKEREQQKAKSKLKLKYTWLAIACSLFVAVGTYLFISVDQEKIIDDKNQIVSKTDAKPAIINEIKSTKNEVVISKQRKIAFTPQKEDPFKEIYVGLVDSSSVANRMNAIIKANALTSLTDKLKTALCRTFSQDSNDNVRLAALEVVSKFRNDSYVYSQLVTALIEQKDPVVQLELVKIMGYNSNPETTEKLIAMANNPSTVDAVKDQVHYALLTNNNQTN